MTNSLYTIRELKLENGVIKPIMNFNDFSEIIDIFKEPPFSEPLTDDDKINEYAGYLKNGLALGYYSNEGEIMGYAGIMKEVEDEHAPYFNSGVSSLSPFYIYGLATKAKYRGHGICSTLVNYTEYIAKQIDVDFIYLRINEEGSMSEDLCRKQGFDDLYQDGKKVVQAVEFERNNPDVPSVDNRCFLIKPITENGNDFITKTASRRNKAKVLRKIK